MCVRVYVYIPCRPTISATCSDVGTRTVSVVFELFFAADDEESTGPPAPVDDGDPESGEEDAVDRPTPPLAIVGSGPLLSATVDDD